MVRERDVRCDDLNTMRSLGRAMKGALLFGGLGSMTQLRDMTPVWDEVPGPAAKPYSCFVDFERS